MSEIALAKINSFAPKQANVSPEEPIFVLTSSQLKQILGGATKSLNSRIDAMEAMITHLEEENVDLRATLVRQDEKLDQSFGNLSLEIALDRQRLTKLEQVEPQPLQKDRGEILRALVVANGGRMLALDARKKMNLGKATFSQLLKTLKDDIGIKEYHLNRSKKIIFLK